MSVPVRRPSCFVMLSAIDWRRLDMCGWLGESAVYAIKIIVILRYSIFIRKKLVHRLIIFILIVKAPNP